MYLLFDLLGASSWRLVYCVHSFSSTICVVPFTCPPKTEQPKERIKALINAIETPLINLTMHTATNSNCKPISSRKKTKSNGLFRNTLILLIVAAIVLSLFTLALSWVAIQRDEARNELNASPTRLDAPISEPRLRRPSEVDVNKISIEKQTVEIVHTNNQPTPKLVAPAATADKNSNSVIYQPDPNSGKRLLTYKRFGGRLNNQLFQFITALQHAKVMKRTLVVPDEIREVDWTGMFDTELGIWDIDSLNAAYDIDWTTGLSDDFTTPDECLLHWKEGPKLLNGGPKHWEEWDRKCPDVINIAGNTGLLFCERQHQFCGDAEAQKEAYKIYSHWKLSPELMDYIPSKREEFKNKGYDEMAIHSRRAGEGGYDWELCINGNRKTCKQHLDTDVSKQFCDPRTIKGNCAIWMDLDYQIKSKSVLKNNEKDYKFVLASDGTHDWSIDFDGQFVVANNTEWLLAKQKHALEVINSGKSLDSTLAVSSFAKHRLRGQTDLSRLLSTLDALTATLLDLFSLVDSKYLLGGYYSTLSLNACFLRGLDRMYDSNMCWMLMHTDTKHAIPPPMEETAHVGGDERNDIPAALMSDIEHAFVRNKDGQFIAIDRYLIPSEKGKQVIGILGDGYVPITIEKDEKGEESIRADFTCSMGNEVDTPATVVLMKGDQSYDEHYFKRGEKYKTPFSTNGDRFRTLIVLCENLTFDKSLSRHPPLILKALDGKVLLSIGSTFARPMNKSNTKKTAAAGKSDQKELVYCL